MSKVRTGWKNKLMERLVDFDDKGIAHMLLEEDIRKEFYGKN